MTGPTRYCWSCYADGIDGPGRCPRCGGTVEPPPDADYVDRLIWALDHPLAERRMIAARVLGQRRERRALDRLEGLARARDDPYLAAEATAAVVAIAGVRASATLLAELAEHPGAPVRHAARALLAREADTR